MKKRILQLLTGDMGLYGIGQVVRTYTYYLKDEYEFDFIICGKTELADVEFIKSIGANLIKIPYKRLKDPIRYMMALKTILRTNRYYAVHIHGNSGTMALETAAGKKAGIRRIIVHCHNSSCRFKLIHYLFKRKMNKEMTIGIACSRKAGEWVFQRNFTVLNNAIDSHRFAFDAKKRKNIRERLSIDRKFVLLNVGRLSKQKNQIFLINLFPEVIKKIPNALLVLVGDGNERALLDRQIYELGIKENVLFLGKQECVEPYYSAADLFVFPSTFEGLGLALVEAQANGLMCLASTEVPKEADVTNTVKYIPLSKRNKWIAYILSANKEGNREEDSKNAIQLIKKKKYDINTNVEQLKAIYEVKSYER